MSIYQEEVIHNATCDSCDKAIIGTRYKCLNCKDFDLCQKCEKNSLNIHNKNHTFLEILYPINNMNSKFPFSVFIDEKPKIMTHYGIICDHCECVILGTRFMCINCQNYDLCESCHQKSVHYVFHQFVVAKNSLKDRKSCPYLPVFIKEVYEKKNKVEFELKELPINENRKNNITNV